MYLYSVCCGCCKFKSMFDSVRCWCNFLRVAQKLDATQRARKSKTRTINGHDVQLLARLFLKFTIFYETAVDGSTIQERIPFSEQDPLQLWEGNSFSKSIFRPLKLKPYFRETRNATRVYPEPSIMPFLTQKWSNNGQEIPLLRQRK